MSTGERIKAARCAAGLTQKQLADKMGISYVNISQLENGRDKRGPTQETLKKIAEALEVPLNALLDAEIESLHVFSFSDSGAAPRTPEEVARRLQALGEKALEIADSLEKLNAAGQQEAVKRVKELTHVPGYQKK